jgi:SanA protein
MSDDFSGFKVGLVLGTSKYTRDNRKNLFYHYRIKTTAALFENGKIKYVLISGDNSTKYYNEPVEMKKDLMKRGIPEDKIYLDYAGFRTYDSMVRAKEIFGLDSLLVISQDFHVKRAIFIGRHKGIYVEGVRTEKITGPSKYKILLREVGARIKATWDLIWGTRPKFLGDKIVIE